MHVDRDLNDDGDFGPHRVLRDNVTSIATDQERRNVDRVATTVISHHDSFGQFDLVVEDEGSAGTCLLDIADFMGESAVATLDHYDRYNHVYFVFEECFLALFGEVFFFERLTSKFVKLRKENLRDL